MKPFTLNFLKPKAASAAPFYRELAPDSDTATRINQYAALVLKKVREKVGSAAGYDEATVKWLSDDVTAGRLRYDAGTKERIANLYGAFLGMALIHNYKQYDPRWVQTDDAIGILFASAPTTAAKIAFPITRVQKHLNEGETWSLYSLFQSIPEFAATEPTD